jgi:cell division protein ZapA
MKRSIAIRIAGADLTLKSDAEASYVERLAKLVDARVRSVQGGARGASAHAVALLAALQLADELHRERERRAELRRRIRERTLAVRRLLEREARS